MQDFGEYHGKQESLLFDALKVQRSRYTWCQGVDAGFASQINSESIDEVLENIRNRKNIDKCGSCAYLDECGGARCIAYALTGNYMAKDPQCWIRSSIPNSTAMLLTDESISFFL